jgi:beta-galactosidase
VFHRTRTKQETDLVTDYSLVVPALEPAVVADVEMGDAPGSGRAITITDRYVERDGVPWMPVMGEYHFSRDSRGSWERELKKLKAGGVDVVATYVLWILHEEIEGTVLWHDNLDLRAFVELAGRVGLTVMARIGPWVHGETRNGGFPDWVQSRAVQLRTDDPAYLELVRGWYAAVAGQLDGLIHSPENPDAPVIGIQVDNELYHQPEHLDTLRRIAEEAGMKASLWIATGWGGAQIPADRFMPVYAGYPDGFWEESTVEWPEFGREHFRFSAERDDLTVGADLRDTAAVASARDYRYPFVTCELGGGMQVAYHRRPLVDSVDVASLALSKLGSGSAWQGYYLYHGVVQQQGELSSTQESHETWYPNDLPQRDYDFFAPLGSFGQVREHYHLLRQQHLFLAEHGAELATYPATIAPETVGVPRFSVRLAETSLVLPREPLTLPADAYFVWPLNQRYGEVASLTGTVQPITSIETENGLVAVFAAIDGIDVELQLAGLTAAQVLGADVVAGGETDARAGAGADADGRLVVRPSVAPGPECVITIGSTRLVILDAATASRVWRGEIDGTDSLVIWDGGLTFDGGLELFTASKASDLLVLPALAPGSLPPTVAELGARGPFSSYAVTGPATSAPANIEVLAETTGVAPVRTGGSSNRFSAPTTADFEAHAAVYEITARVEPLDPPDQVLLRVEWTGDAARAFLDGQFVSDQFWSGRSWDIELTGDGDDGRHAVRIQALPWQPQSGVFVDARVRPNPQLPLLELRSAEVIVTRGIRIGAAAASA